jgi:hypothetical protein
MTKVTCNGCGYTGGPDGQDWEVTSSAYAWGRCPKCGTTNLEVKETCGEKKHHGIYGIEPCKKCESPKSSEKN